MNDRLKVNETPNIAVIVFLHTFFFEHVQNIYWNKFNVFSQDTINGYAYNGN